jgi:hypothetical protein
MEIPSILQGESLTRLIQGLAIGAVTTMFVRMDAGGARACAEALSGDKAARLN